MAQITRLDFTKTLSRTPDALRNWTNARSH